ncbi:MAG: bifunctional 5,10-methylene-tetrahydrofolate dehydrogenase/5,10-methylene-tetrahydrofolate cyclohydrolase [Candidatus Rokuibacteriota bacterium]|nr:MAG: bifunctional 5,10-methylene-tetrahydrofolate dehydrogenase/5,10-methylene-tetrahydrofolate cyclohydrolase [Candidatus Rokubacteria bacterium]
MPVTLMQGAPVAARIRAEVARDVEDLGRVGLATVLVGDDPASHIYIDKKHEAARAAGMRPRDERRPSDTSQEELLDLLAELNADDTVDGILVQLPLPRHIEDRAVLEAVDPTKDVDGFHPINAGRLYLGQETLVPATPLGIMALLDEYGVELEGARGVVVGRSTIVGKPIAMLLLGANATVTVCHSRTRDLAERTREADVLVVAAGRAGVVTADMVKPGAAVVDVGQNRTENGLVGDVSPEVGEVAGWYTPVPGGVGPMTIAMLLRNTVQAARSRRSAATVAPQ